MCHATGTAFLQLNSLSARYCTKCLDIHPVLVVGFNLGLLLCHEPVTFCLDITPVCWWHIALPFLCYAIVINPVLVAGQIFALQLRCDFGILALCYVIALITYQAQTKH